MAEIFKPPPELSLEGNLAENWRQWEQRLDIYMEASGADQHAQKKQVAILLHCVGADALEVFNTFAWEDPVVDGDNVTYPDGENKNLLADVVRKFKAYCNPRKNSMYERYKLILEYRARGGGNNRPIRH
jgi:hypothetical protein